MSAKKKQHVDRLAVERILDNKGPAGILGPFTNLGVSGQELIPRYLSDLIIEQIPRHGVVRRFGRTDDVTDAETRIRVMKSIVPMVQHRKRNDTRTIPDVNIGFTTGVDLNLNIDFVRFSLSLDLIEGSRGMLDALSIAAARALAAKEDQNAFVGDESQDSGFTLGICNALLASSLHEGGSSAANVVFDDFLQTQAMLPELASAKPRWYMSRAFYTLACLRLYGAAGAGMQIPEDADGMLLNHPVNFISGMPGADATTGDVAAVFGHLELASSLGYDRELRYAANLDFETDEVHFLVKQWTDFRVWDRGHADSAAAAGSLVGLQLGS